MKPSLPELDRLQSLEEQLSSLEGIVCNLTQGVARLAQVVGVFPGLAASPDQVEDDVHIDLLQWQDCAKNMVAFVASRLVISQLCRQYVWEKHGKFGVTGKHDHY
ncbi:hypothetical protein Pmar_PMAR018767 [Perkinsus marinus ATCC 50983]|uniref:Uncharacterized protein n=1 Tax=Perkinsus marinus (strain ATCC 50983 / TXsc) TaxID=423536 RepID=C5KJB4_PERM5|nr:hypothetical protein Pmar_PMAR018767 [Perkinsus marinus ATCC 50983]EER15416.1 hypothetical protein Pmar_PMAR018767 [Perkinsus marinus ATCC 50983]|eukprot:XP_002783620.1 hypothetical protein Pmar_PMAR018767 [Perkinsus marinus ATCC 50983]